VLLSRTPESQQAGRRISASLPWFLDFLDRRGR
jgi:hypothetical protein